jgi:hypothetical protein
MSVPHWLTVEAGTRGSGFGAGGTQSRPKQRGLGGDPVHVLLLLPMKCAPLLVRRLLLRRLFLLEQALGADKAGEDH